MIKILLSSRSPPKKERDNDKKLLSKRSPKEERDNDKHTIILNVIRLTKINHLIAVGFRGH